MCLPEGYILENLSFEIAPEVIRTENIMRLCTVSIFF